MISKDLEISLRFALEEARKRRHEYLCVEHLLYALLEDAYGMEILESCGGSVHILKEWLDAFLREELEAASEEDGVPVLQQTPAFERLMQRAISHVQYSGKKEADAGDVLAAIFEEEDSHAAFYLQRQGISRLDILDYISHGVGRNSSSSHLPSRRSSPAHDSKDSLGKDKEPSEPSVLEIFTVNLNKLAADGGIDPLIGREQELKRCVQVLCRRRKNNPVFVGEPGVGKTALAEGLALRIHEGRVPKVLQDVEILALDLPGMIAGTKFRGEFEQRLKTVLQALQEQENVILYIDEIHGVVGAGATSESSMDASTILKPALASGALRCIGSTTYEEYKNHFEKDRGLTRRFQKIDVDEPSIEETVRILRGLKSRYETHHGIQYTESALQSAAELSSKHINDRFLPDKAIDVIDEAAAEVRLMSVDKPRKTVRPADIERVVAAIAKIPERSVSSSDREKLGHLEHELKGLVYGQDSAIEQISRAIKRSRAGLGRQEKPIGCFLFAGPTGVGKTEVARQLASILGNHFARYDMSEYMEKHAVARLIGAPPGYVGFDQGGLLVDEIRRNPYTVLLLDEVEKAHPDLFSILLQVMDSATLTDNMGKKADFRNVILIMTSNAGARELAKSSIGFQSITQDSQHKSLKAIEQAFTPEFRNRLDAVVAFNPLPIDIIEMVVSKFLNQLEIQLGARRVRLDITPAAKRWIAEHGYDSKFGARPLARLIEQKIETPLADELLFGRLEKGGVVVIDVRSGELHLEYELELANKDK